MQTVSAFASWEACSGWPDLEGRRMTCILGMGWRCSPALTAIFAPGSASSQMNFGHRHTSTPAPGDSHHLGILLGFLGLTGQSTFVFLRYRNVTPFASWVRYRASNSAPATTGRRRADQFSVSC